MSDLNEYKQRRLGRINMTRQFLDDLPQEAFRKLKEKIFVLQTDHDVITQTIEAVCSSEDFRVVDEGETIPCYYPQVVCTTTDDSEEPEYMISITEVE